MTFEYCLLSGVNDLPAHAEELAALLKGHDAMRSHVNVGGIGFDFRAGRMPRCNRTRAPAAAWCLCLRCWLLTF